MPVSKLADEHPLTKAGLRCVYVVEKAELGLRPGDIVFEFPFGRIVDTSMACRRDGIIPPEIDIMAIHKEANATRAALPRHSQLIGSTLAAARGARFTIAQDGRRGDPWPHNHAESGECRLYTQPHRCGLMPRRLFGFIECRPAPHAP